MAAMTRTTQVDNISYHLGKEIVLKFRSTGFRKPISLCLVQTDLVGI